MLIICSVCAVVIAAILQRQRHHYPGLGLISCMFGLHAVGLLFLTLQGILPLFWSSLVANILIVSGFMSGLFGIGAFVQRPFKRGLPFLLFLVFLGFHIFWLYVQPDLQLRSLNLLGIALIYSLLSAGRLLKPKKTNLISFTRYSGMIYLFFCVILLIRCVMILAKPDPAEQFIDSGGYEPVFFIGFQVSYILITFFLLVMVNKRLLYDKELALSEVRILSGMLPICASCKNIRDDQGYWKRIEDYLHTHSEAEFSHSICPECAKKLYPDLYGEIQNVQDQD